MEIERGLKKYIIVEVDGNNHREFYVNLPPMSVAVAKKIAREITHEFNNPKIRHWIIVDQNYKIPKRRALRKKEIIITALNIHLNMISHGIVRTWGDSKEIKETIGDFMDEFGREDL